MNSEIQMAADGQVNERTDGQDRHDGLWIDDPAADAIRRSPRGFLRRHTADLVERGVTLIEGAVTPELCDELRDDYERFCEDQPADIQVRDAHGHRIRLANFQMGSEAARRIARNPKVMELVDHVLGSRGVIYSSLLFDVGTEQVMHRDTPYFFTDPPGRFVGVWTALEDVRPEAGPLMYYEGGHRVPDAEVVLEAIRAYPGEHGPVADLGGERYATYNATVERRCLELGLKRVDRTLSKGDTLIWHPMLPHGGAPIVDPSMTRTSIVFHVIAQGATMRPVDEHLALGPVTPSAPLEVIESEGREFVDHGYSHFQVGD